MIAKDCYTNGVSDAFIFHGFIFLGFKDAKNSDCSHEIFTFVLPHESNG